MNEYSGYKLNDKENTIKTISTCDVTSKSFFDQYISTRMPVLFTDHIQDKEWKASNWTDSYLKVLHCLFYNHLYFD